LALQPQFGPWPTSMKFSVLFGLLDLRHSVGILGWVISSSQGLHLYTNTGKRTYKRQTSKPWVGFEPTIPASERAKTVHALDCSATVTGNNNNNNNNNNNVFEIGWICKMHTVTWSERNLERRDSWFPDADEEDNTKMEIREMGRKNAKSAG
jgi:hypothetical protein